MKTTKYIWMALILFAGMTFMAGCETNIEPEKQEKVEGPVLLMAEGFNSSTSTKTSVSGNTVQWVNEDVVILNGDSYEVSVSGNTASVDADLLIGQPVYGSYACVFSSQSTTPTVDIPARYDWKSGDGGRQIIELPMAAYSATAGNTVTFKHLTAAVEITIWNATSSKLFVDEVTLTSDSYRLNGSCQLDLTAANFGITTDNDNVPEANRTVSIVISPTKPLTIEAGETHAIQVPILPIGDDDLTIHIGSHNKDINGVPVSGLTHTFNYKASSTALGRNQMLSAKVKISPQSANVFSKGTFSISDTEAIYFSKGNLQATTTDGGTNWSWGFAPTQLSYIGAVDANNNLTANNFVTTTDPWFDATKNGTVDLFGWVQGRSNLADSTASGAPYGIAGAAQSYFEGYYSDGLAHDWGETIGSGWFTLSKDQWRYLLYYRGNEGKAPTTHYDVESSGNIAARWFKAKVADVDGLVLIPDDFIWPATVTMKAGLITKDGDAFPVMNNQNSSYRYIIDATEWTALEGAGCVFLPAAGWREGSEVKHVPGANTQNYNSPWGYYWSSTYDYNGRMVYALDFMTNGLSFGTTAWSYPDRGLSVRLAYPAN